MRLPLPLLALLRDSIGLALIREAQAAARRESVLMTDDMLSDADRAVLGRRWLDALSAERTLADRRQASAGRPATVA